MIPLRFSVSVFLIIPLFLFSRHPIICNPLNVISSHTQTQACIILNYFVSVSWSVSVLYSQPQIVSFIYLYLCNFEVFKHFWHLSIVPPSGQIVAILDIQLKCDVE